MSELTSESPITAQTGFELNEGPYTPLTSAYDEMTDKSGKVRGHWRPVARYFRDVSRQDLQDLKKESRRRLKEQGVNYNVYNDPEGMRRPWQLDPVPMLFEEKDWVKLEAGLQQRARLFSCVLGDLLGARTLLKKGLLPPELVFQHPDFVPSLENTGGQPLTLYAADVARGPDGNWWVVSDKTQGPSGAGYALEARMVSRRLLNQRSLAYSIAPISQYFHHLKRHLAALSPDKQKEPTIALLSPGIGNEVYFEHALLAGQLGLTLVQGDDLTVRQGRVYLKTVDDLQQVDVLVRRVDDAYCDPLHFHMESMLGTPGLAQAQLMGRVGMANPLGSGLLESAGLLPFMPRLAKHFLGEELQLPVVATWWCGHAKECKYVLENLAKLVIKRTDRSATTIYGANLSKKEASQLKGRIKATPWLFVGQQALSFSTVPTLVDDSIQPRHLLLRTFAAGDGEHYDVMPGGLSRLSTGANTFVVSSQRGGLNKDTWVLRRSGAAKEVLRPHAGHQRRTASAVLTSRAAENLFWMARYLERSESLLRLLRAYKNQLDDYLDYGSETEAKVLNAMRPLLELYCPIGENALPHIDSLQPFLLDSDHIGSVAYNIRAAINTAYTVRDLWSGDCWRAIEELEELHAYTGKNVQGLALDQLIQPFLTALLAFWGASQESLALNQGGLWVQCGKRLERAQNIAAAIHGILPELDEQTEFGLRQVLLAAHDSRNSHRRRYGTDLTYYTAWQHLLLEPTNPRSLLSTVSELEKLLRSLNSNPNQGLISLEKKALALMTPLRLADAKDWHNQELTQTELAGFLQTNRQTLRELAADLEHQYFKHAQPITRLMR